MFDLVIVGSGAAGMAAALEAAPRRVALIAPPEGLTRSATQWSQGGIAAAIGPDDSPAAHAADTRIAGAGRGDPAAIEAVTAAAPAAIAWLVDLGCPFDRGADGSLALGREAAHSRPRIVHAGDASGAAVMATLARAVAAAAHIQRIEGRVAALLPDRAGQRAAGVWLEDGRIVAAPHIMLATGGIGQLYRTTTNPSGTGAGLSLAYRLATQLEMPQPAGLFRDLGFVQFHPTALALPDAPKPAPLLTEALRGAGAWLVDRAGCRFVLEDHPDGELAPRDVVARAVHRARASGRGAYLDVRPLGAALARFGNALATAPPAALAAGLLPVGPAAHYHMGGLIAGLDGRTALPGLWVAGEAASTGLHGANRLASNSVLEALVCGRWAGAALRATASATATPNERLPHPAAPDAAWLAGIGPLLDEELGVERSGPGLARVAAAAEAGLDRHPAARLVLMMAEDALAQSANSGAHHRTDLPPAEPAARCAA